MESLPTVAKPWKPLADPSKWIRVIELLPSPSGPIRVRLHDQKLSSPRTRYEAVSYTWGDRKEQEEIILENQRHQIRRNLWTFLARLRQPQKSRYLWADALCIDQQNLVEKGHQVTIIGEIFKTASTVLVWLGEADDGNDAILDTASQISIFDWWLILGQNDPRVQRAKHSAHIILKRPYWTRTWIVQELIVAKKIVVHYGSRQASWAAFTTFITECSEWGQAGRVTFDKVAEQRRNFHRFGYLHVNCWLFENVSSFAHTNCDDPRDKIYSLLSVSMPPINGVPFPVDYSKEVTLYELLFRILETSYGFMKANPFYVLAHLMEVLGLDQEDFSRRLEERGGLRRERPSLPQYLGIRTKMELGALRRALVGFTKPVKMVRRGWMSPSFCKKAVAYRWGDRQLMLDQAWKGF